MNNFDRGMIKWMPFNAVVPSNQIVNEILKEKNKIKMPILSSEQKQSIEEKIINAFYEKSSIKILYYYDGKCNIFEGTIKKIDSINNKIYFNNKVLIFNQIVKII